MRKFSSSLLTIAFAFVVFGIGLSLIGHYIAVFLLMIGVVAIIATILILTVQYLRRDNNHRRY